MSYSNYNFGWVTKDARKFLSRGYLPKNQTLEERFKFIADKLEERSGIKGFSDKVYDYCSKGWISFATPVLINYGHGDNLPASCNYSSIEDSLDGIFSTLYETANLAKYGAGTAVNFSYIRPLGSNIATGGQSNGPVPWVKMYEESINKVSQGNSRRGFLTSYMSADHKDIIDFLDIGTPNNDIQHITTGVVFPRGYMQDMLNGDKHKREVYAKVLKRRSEIGFPYIMFEDNAHENIPNPLRSRTKRIINTSNICTEVLGDVDPVSETFVCVLSSVNLLYYDQWKNTDLVYDLRIILDLVTQEYIDKARGRKGFDRAIKYIEEHRSVGLGVLGWHSYLQSKMIPVGSLQAFSFNNEVFSFLRSECDRANMWMAEKWGEAPYCKGFGLRGDLSIAIAPTKSTSFIMGGVSSGIEPIKSNYHEKVLAKIQSEYRNPELVKLLQSLGKDDDEVWNSIGLNNGSVQHLEFLTPLQKEVFKTFSEVSQLDLIKLAAQRQKYIDQSQSLNLMIHPDTPPKDVSKLIITAWDEGIKTLYYQYSINAAQKFSKELLECSNCEG